MTTQTCGLCSRDEYLPLVFGHLWLSGRAFPFVPRKNTVVRSLTYTHYYHTRRQTFDEWMHLLPPDLSVTTLCHMLKKKVLGYYLIRRAVWSSFDLHHVVLVTNHQSYSWKKERKQKPDPVIHFISKEVSRRVITSHCYCSPQIVCPCGELVQIFRNF